MEPPKKRQSQFPKKGSFRKSENLVFTMKRSEAREQAFLLVFEKSFHGYEIPEAIEAAMQARELTGDAFMEQLAEGVFAHLDEIDEAIESHCIGWKKARIPRVSLSIMRLCVYELLYEKDIPDSVSINEAVELAKRFANEDDAVYINGVLGAIQREKEGAGQ